MCFFVYVCMCVCSYHVDVLAGAPMSTYPGKNAIIN